MTIDTRQFEQKLATYPTPIALGCGRICRARTPQDGLDAILKCAELVTRYLAAVSVCSLAARVDKDEPIPQNLTNISGNLSLGDFLTIVQSIANSNVEHPLRAGLSAAIKGKGRDAGPADVGLTELLELRNRLGHDLMGMTEAKAISIFREDTPDDHLKSSLLALEPLLGLPLFVVEDVRVIGRSKYLARRLLLMGESTDPLPEEIEVDGGFENQKTIYLGVPDGVISLFPFLVWDLVNPKSNYGIYFVNGFSNNGLRLITVHSDQFELKDPGYAQARELLGGKTVEKETVGLASGKTFYSHWVDARRTIDQTSDLISGRVSWEEFDTATLSWYGARLGSSSEEETRTIIVDRLLDGREYLTPVEVNQMKLLFGNNGAIRSLIGRQMLDCRAKKSTESRWDERVESSANILECLKLGIEFFGKHVGLDGFTLDGLAAVSGSADYIAMREGLVNLFIHQDYKDSSTASQIEISIDRAVFFNAGKSLVSNNALVDGGKSQCRNPLIARALRTIGFAELAGSGLRELHHVWRAAKRRPPITESNSSANTFTLILDWRDMPDTSDAFWKGKLGLALTSQEATVLALSADPSGLTVEQAASSLGILIYDAEDIVRNLARQALVDKEGNRISIKAHLRALVEESR